MSKKTAVKFDLPKLAISLVIPHLVGFFGVISFSPNAIANFYGSLFLPSFAPPSWVFGQVWPILYTLMGISLYLVWRHSILKKEVKEAVSLFLIHLLFNASWSVVFFGLKSPSLALVNITVLLMLVVIVMVKFSKIDKIATYLLWPYLVWVSFAAILNYSIWILNR